MRTPYPYNKQRNENIRDENFSDPYLWFSPQVREAIQSKAESLIQQVHEDVSTQETFSDHWEDISNYDISDLKSNTTEDIDDNPDADVIPIQEIELNPDISENQEYQEADDVEINTPDDEIEDLISEQQELIEDQINDLQQVNDSDIREGEFITNEEISSF